MASTTPRFGYAKNEDNTGRVLTMDFKAPVYAATVALKPNAGITTVVVGQLTGACTVTATTTNSFAGDVLRIVFSVDGTNRTVTFGTGFQPSATLALTASKYGSATFIFSGTTWVESGRAVTA